MGNWSKALRSGGRRQEKADTPRMRNDGKEGKGMGGEGGGKRKETELLFLVFHPMKSFLPKTNEDSAAVSHVTL